MSAIDVLLVYSVQFRKPQARKNKTWEDDGVLTIKGNHATLRDEAGKFVTFGTINRVLVEDDEVVVGTKEVKVEMVLPPDSVEDSMARRAGSGPGHEDTPLPPERHNSITKTPLRSLGSRTIHKPFKPPQLNPNPNLVGERGGARPFKKPRLVELNEVGELERKLSTLSQDDPFHTDAPSTKSQTDAKKLEKEYDSIIEEATTMETTSFLDHKLDGLNSSGTTRTCSIEKDENGRRRRPWDIEESSSNPSYPGGAIITPKIQSQLKTRYFTCQYRAQQTIRKNATWTGDGFVVLTNTNKLVLYDQTTGDELGNGRLPKDMEHQDLEVGSNLIIGSKVTELDELITEEQYLKLKNSIGQGQNITKTEVPSTSNPELKSDIKSFYLPGIVKPTITLSAASPLLTLSKLSSGPRFDPTAKGAIVLPRPPQDVHKDEKVVDVVVDPILGSKLREHQIEGVKFMYECVMGYHSDHQGCILADDMGLGKSIQAITLLWTLLKQNPFPVRRGKGLGVIERVVLTCPVSLVKNWSREIIKWLGRDRIRMFVMDEKKDISSFLIGRTYNLLIIGYEKLRTVIRDLKACVPPIGLLICDEGHRLKSPNAKITQSLMELNVTKRVILSGTPVQNNLSELWGLGEVVCPGIFGDYNMFKKNFETPITKSREPRAKQKDKDIGKEKLDELNELIATFILRRDKEVIKNYLPPKYEYTLFIQPTPLQRRIYKAILQGSAVRSLLEGDSQRGQQFSLLMTLRKVCLSPGLLVKQIREKVGLDAITPSVHSLVGTIRDPSEFLLSGKLSVLGHLLAVLYSAKIEKIVLVSNFTTTLDLVQVYCERNQYPFKRLDGTTAAKDRIKLVEDFNKESISKSFVFLLSSKSGGVGLNMIGASRLVLLDGDWNPATDLQAMARIHRQGQQKPCFIYRFMQTGMMDEKIFQRQVTKVGLSDSLLNSTTITDKEQDLTSSLGGGTKGNAFSKEELKSIFSLHEETECQTHDLLGCVCPADGSLPELNIEEPISPFSEEEDEEGEGGSKLPGFVPASQYSADEQEDPSRDRRMLNALATQYMHLRTTTEEVVEEIEDLALRGVIYESLIGVPTLEIEPDEQEEDLRWKGGEISFVFKSL